MKSTRTPKSEVFYLKFYVIYGCHVRSAANRNVTAEVEVPAYKLNEDEKEYLRTHIHQNWLFEVRQKERIWSKPKVDPGTENVLVTLILTSTAADAPWNALRDHLSRKVRLS